MDDEQVSTGMMKVVPPAWEENVDMQEIEEVYVHAITVSDASNTLRIPSHLGKRPIIILIDSESTHSFLAPRLAREVGFSIANIFSLTITLQMAKICSVNKSVLPNG